MESGILRLSVSGLLAIITLTSCSSNLPISSVENNSNKINSSTGVNQNVESTLITGKIDYQSGLKIKASFAHPKELQGTCQSTRRCAFWPVRESTLSGKALCACP